MLDYIILRDIFFVPYPGCISQYCVDSHDVVYAPQYVAVHCERPCVLVASVWSVYRRVVEHSSASPYMPLHGVVSEQVYKGLKDYTHPQRRCQEWASRTQGFGLIWLYHSAVVCHTLLLACRGISDITASCPLFTDYNAACLYC